MRPAPPSFRSAHTMTAPVKDSARRQFILDTTKMACGMGVLGLGLGLVNKQAKARKEEISLSDELEPVEPTGVGMLQPALYEPRDARSFVVGRRRHREGGQARTWRGHPIAHANTKNRRATV